MLMTALLLLIVLIALSLPIAAALGVMAVTLDRTFGFLPLYQASGEVAWTASSGFLLMAIPLFVLLGEIMLRSGVADAMYDALAKWLGWLPGGVMHANIGACALFSATSGSSVATAATIGTVAVPQIDRHGYGPRLFLGTLAAGGTLGILIPPSVNLIIYGILTNTSVPQLYIAGIIPGLMLAWLFMAAIIAIVLLRPEMAGHRARYTLAERFAGTIGVLPPILVFVVVIGSIYAGFATPTEAAALGVVAALIIAAGRGRLNWKMLNEALEGTVVTTAMIVLIIIAAYILNMILSGIGLTSQLNQFVTGLGLTPMQMLLAVVIFYVVLGCFMETLSMMITTIPIIAPLMFSLGFDPVWYGIVMMILIETALITPPIGLNLYVVQGVRGRGPMTDVMLGALPFVAAMAAMIALLALFPNLALWLPDMLMR
ncbi:TRAP transporter large permease [Sulfitobacter sp. TSTF-M16]|uniref:TRAP transporter large permease protein n=1 Tax=Sulfitobacter aestuariivivens TaxID=2766981 RepID=A0A927D9K3_9RHOB|nr:TRAP transporter large permease [Sulfitobacter aestuariivivens]MBD3666254.1 TRAP transporter large permease [Sulfitobacter aestuariivivens]